MSLILLPDSPLGEQQKTLVFPGDSKAREKLRDSVFHSHLSSSITSGKAGPWGERVWQLRREQMHSSPEYGKFHRKAHGGSGRVSRELSVQRVLLVKKSHLGNKE